MSVRTATSLALVLVALVAAGVALGADRQPAATDARHRDFHGTVVWAQGVTKTFALRTRAHGVVHRFVATAQTRYDHMRGFSGCRAGRRLAVHARWNGARWIALEIRHERNGGGDWHDGHGDHWGGSHHGDRG